MLSLSSFHIVFVVASILLSVAVGAWGVQQYLHHDSVAGLILAAPFFLAGILLLLYGLKYFAKLRHLD